MKKNTRKAHGSKLYTKKLTANKLAKVKLNKKATGVRQPKKGVTVTALKKRKINLEQAISGGLIKRTKPKKSKNIKKYGKSPFEVPGNKRSKNDDALKNETIISSSSSPNYVQQSSNSKNKTRLAKPSAKIIESPHPNDLNLEQDPKHFPDQLENIDNPEY